MNLKDVENLAELAKLELSEEEKNGLLKDMEGILGYVRQIEEAELGEEAGAEGSESTIINAWREDLDQSPDFSRELILEQFPDSQDGFLKVKKIL